MTIDVKVPVLPESVEDATIAVWHKKPGDSVQRDEKLVDLETDKVVLEVPSPADGTVLEIRAQEGETVLSDDVLAVIEEGAVEPAATETAKAPAAEDSAPAPEPAPAATPAAVATAGEAPKLSPAARRVAEEEKVDVERVAGTGRGGRVTKGDVLSFLKGGGSARKSASR